MSEETKPETTPETPAPKPEAGEGSALLARLAAEDKAKREAAQAARTHAPAAAPKAAPAKDTSQERLDSLERMMLEREHREQQQAREAQLHGARQKVEQFVKEREEDFPFLTALELETVVFDRMLLAQEQGQTLSEVAAAREIEQSLAQKLDKVAKIKALREKVLESQQSAASTVPTKRQPTLTNDLTTSAPTRPDTDLESMDEALAEMERALLRAVR